MELLELLEPVELLEPAELEELTEELLLEAAELLELAIVELLDWALDDEAATLKLDDVAATDVGEVGPSPKHPVRPALVVIIAAPDNLSRKSLRPDVSSSLDFSDNQIILSS